MAITALAVALAIIVAVVAVAVKTTAVADADYSGIKKSGADFIQPLRFMLFYI